MIKDTIKNIGKWTGDAFSENGTPSSSRLLTLLHSVIACTGFTFVTIHTRAIPDAATMVGLGGFATVHYLVNSTKSAIQSFSKDKDAQ